MNDEKERALRGRIDDTRERLAGTVEEIGSRVNPDRVRGELRARARDEVDHMKETIKAKTRSTMRDLENEVEERGRGLLHTIKENPVPASMVGVGIAWLVANGNSKPDGHGRWAPAEGRQARWRSPDPHGRPGEYPREASVDGQGGHGAGEKAKEAAHRARETVEERTEEVREQARGAVEQTREKVSHLASEASHRVSDTRERAGEWVDRAERRAMRVEHRVEDAVHDNPIAAGALAVALGFAAGMMIPESSREREMFGDTRDRLVERGKHEARRAAEKAHDTVRETAGDAARRAVDEAWPQGGEREESEVRSGDRS